MEGIHAYVRLKVFKLSPTDAAQKVELRYGVFDTDDLLRDEIGLSQSDIVMWIDTRCLTVSLQCLKSGKED